MTGKPYPQQFYPGCPCHKHDSPTWETVHMGSFDVPMTRMSLCPHCGNKRCPGAVDCDNECTGSNAVGQPGSFYHGDLQSTPEQCSRCLAAITWTETHGWQTITGAPGCPDGNPHHPKETQRNAPSTPH